MDTMIKIVNGLAARPDSVPFRDPVDYRGLGLYDYPQIIKKPMDLATVKANIEKNAYGSLTECAEDIRKIWANCKKYNQDGSDFYNLADAFSKRFEEKFSKIKTEEAVEEPVEDKVDHAPSLEEKTKFSHNIYKIKQEELGILVDKLDAKCPNAIQKAQNDDEIEINIDAIDPRTFHDLDRYVRQCISQSAPKKKKRAADSSDGKGKKVK
ncbi:Bromodomain-containing protein [Pelagophyceae sp. CCMP2097]|nr:Bromodomain-containing protein [Pelagophyceae sp. CCMP2097]|mmetsp:Transcript_19683/g.69974  ORF Transcript_19683/g.69974 Transcript_19683/m.69974 type:complete len:210 (+) Transcript_19683:115-744(+)